MSGYVVSSLNCAPLPASIPDQTAASLMHTLIPNLELYLLALQPCRYPPGSSAGSALWPMRQCSQWLPALQAGGGASPWCCPSGITPPTAPAAALLQLQKALQHLMTPSLGPTGHTQSSQRQPAPTRQQHQQQPNPHHHQQPQQHQRLRRPAQLPAMAAAA